MDKDNLANLARWASPAGALANLAYLKGYVTLDQLALCLEESGRRPDRKPAEDILVEKGFLTPQQLAELKSSMEAPAPPPAAQAGTFVGRYQLKDKIGEGGGGTVWKAWDTQLRRWIALKQPRVSTGLQRERFLREARAAARLRHPGLVEIYEIGEQAGTDYIVMEFVDGQDLSKSALDPSRAAAVLADVCDAVQHMHENSVLHRDIKPQNILIDAQGRPHLADFGLAKVAGDDTLTRDGACIGTPQYMSPEQIRGEIEAIDARSDVYGLGATFYHLLAGAAPYASEYSMESLVHKVLSDPPPSPRALRSSLDPGTDILIQRAMAKHAEDRYATAKEFGEDLRRFSRGEPLRAQRVSLVVKTRRWFLRNPRLAVAGALAFAGLVAAGILALLYVGNVGEERRYQELLRPADDAWTRVRQYEAVARPDTERRRTTAEDALRKYEALLATFPSDTTARLRQGQCLLILGRDDEALQAFDAVADISDEALFQRARHRLGRIVEFSLPRAVTASPFGVQFARNDPRGPAESALFEKGMEDYEEARRRPRMSPLQLAYLDGLVQMTRGNYKPASTALDTYLREHPWDVSAVQLKALAEYLGLDLVAADRTLTVLLLSRPRPLTYKLRGDIRLCLGRLSEAEADYSDALDRYPEARINRGLVRIDLGAPARALQDFEEAPPSRHRLLLKARTLGLLNRGSEADALFELVKEHDRWDSPDAYLAHGESLLYRKLAGPARAEFEAAIHLSGGKSVAGLRRRAWILAQEGRFTDALRDTGRALELEAGGVETLALHAQILHTLGRTDEAIRSLVQALEIVPPEMPGRKELEDRLAEYRGVK